MCTSAASSAGSRCVLWHAPGTLPPPDLLSSLQRRRVQINPCLSAYAAIALVCLAERENDERTDVPEERESLVLVLVCPRTLEGAADVVDAARRSAARTACWWYDPGANPRLRAVVDEDVRQWNAMAGSAASGMVIRPGESAEARPRLKLYGEGTGNPGPDTAAQASDQGSGDPGGPSAGMSHTQMELRRQGAGGGGLR